MDLIEIDAASNTSVDDVRDLREKVGFAPTEGRYKVYIIDEVHMLSTSAFNALLKTLEEPPPHVIFILATTEVHKVPATVLSRCQRFDFHRIPPDKIAAHLGRVLRAEGVAYERTALEMIARQATGSLRDALSILDQVLASGGDRVTAELVRDVLGLPDAELVASLVDAMLSQEIGQGLKLINTAVDRGADVRQLLVAVLDHLRALLLVAAGSHGHLGLPAELETVLRRQAAGLSPQALAPAIRAFNAAVAELKLGPVPQLPLELAFVEAVMALSPELKAHSPEQPERPMPDPSRPQDGSTHPTFPAKASHHVAPLPASSGSPSSPDPTLPSSAPVSSAGEAETGVETDEAGHGLLWWQHHWPEFLTWLQNRGGGHRRLAVRLKFGRPLALKEDTLMLGFTYSIHRDKVAEPETSRMLQRALQEFAGVPLSVECRWVPDQHHVSPARTKFEKAAEDPLVRAALQLGGHIVDVRVPDQSVDK
ncbi:MAG: DNA polymerase III subunit gamma/tau [Ardenticatenia bacterium]|nr:DNA polymerase III subunit gamma/tau [Ardenticatenia bacterium]